MGSCAFRGVTLVDAEAEATNKGVKPMYAMTSIEAMAATAMPRVFGNGRTLVLMVTSMENCAYLPRKHNSH